MISPSRSVKSKRRVACPPLSTTSGSIRRSLIRGTPGPGGVASKSKMAHPVKSARAMAHRRMARPHSACLVICVLSSCVSLRPPVPASPGGSNTDNLPRTGPELKLRVEGPLPARRDQDALSPLAGLSPLQPVGSKTPPVRQQTDGGIRQQLDITPDPIPPSLSPPPPRSPAHLVAGHPAGIGV